MIPLTQSKFALVDDEDLEWLSKYKWCFHGTKNYAFRGARYDGKTRCIFMHRAILEAPAGVLVDHIDGNGLNNQRANLRLATRQENAHNRARQRNNSSGFKGVCKSQKGLNWRASIRSDGKHFYLGVFETSELAAEAYDKAALELHGKFAKTNNGAIEIAAISLKSATRLRKIRNYDFKKAKFIFERGYY